MRTTMMKVLEIQDGEIVMMLMTGEVITGTEEEIMDDKNGTEEVPGVPVILDLHSTMIVRCGVKQVKRKLLLT